MRWMLVETRAGFLRRAVLRVVSDEQFYCALADNRRR
jgi:hypothetical protein